MSAIANLVVYDGASTPILHTLPAVSVTREKGKVTALWREQLANTPVNAQVSAVVTIERLKSGVWKTAVRVEVPVMESVSGQNAAGYTAAPKVAYVNTVEATGYFHDRSDATGRRNARQMAANILAGHGNTITPQTAGVLPELMDQLVAPT